MRYFRTSIAAALVLALSFLSAGCTTTSSRYRGSLSDAMDKARDDNEGDRDVPDAPRERERPPYRDEDPGYRQEDDRVAADETGGGEPAKLRFGFRGGTAVTDGSDIVTAFDGDFLLDALVSDRFTVDLFAGLKVADAKSGSDLDASIKDSILFLKAGVEGRFAPLPKRTIFSPFLLGGLGGYGMFWSFRNALTAGEETIESDSLGGLLLSVGLGADLLNTERLRIGVTLIQDAYLFSDVTSQGFDNDVFTAYGTARVMGEATFRF